MEINILEYSDYRKFIKDKVDSLKRSSTKFSYRAFNKKAGIKSSAFLKLVMDGKRNLGADGIEAICRGFDLNDKESDYLKTLVHFTQAKDYDNKQHYYNKLVQKSPTEKITIQKHQYDIFSHWYYVAILELLRIDSKGKRDLQWIHENLRPKVGLRETKKAIESLFKLGFIKFQGGEYVRVQSNIHTADEIQSLAISTFHSEMCQMASYKVRHEDAGKREFSSLTVAVSKETFENIRSELREFRKKLHELVESDSKERGKREVLTQIGLHMFQMNQVE